MTTKTKPNEQQSRAIDLLLAGKSITATAEEIGVVRETVSRWLNHDTDFQKLLFERRVEVWDGNADRMRGMLETALDELEDLIGNRNPAIRLKAIDMIISNQTFPTEPPIFDFDF